MPNSSLPSILHAERRTLRMVLARALHETQALADDGIRRRSDSLFLEFLVQSIYFLATKRV
jgi:hypothetical protein